jgi:hypothetical protein
MVQDRRNLERMYEQQERDRQRSEMRQAEARARYAEYERDNRRSQEEAQRRADMYQMEHDRAVHEFEMRSLYERGPSSQSGILGALVLGLLLAAIGAAAWWSFKLLRWGFGHLLRLVGWGGVATLAAVALAGGYAWARFFS